MIRPAVVFASILLSFSLLPDKAAAVIPSREAARDLSIQDAGPSSRSQGRQTLDSARLARLKAEAVSDVDGMQTFIQQMVDQIFSYGELGFQETETSKYLIGILRKNGFTVP